MSQTISVSTTMGEQGFRDFAVFDAFHHRKAWLRPAVFAAIMLAFAAVCLSQLGKRPGAGLLAAVLAIVGIGLPVSYFYSFFHSVSKQIRQMHLPRAFYRVELADTGIAVAAPGLSGHLRREAAGHGPDGSVIPAGQRPPETPKPQTDTGPTYGQPH